MSSDQRTFVATTYPGGSFLAHDGTAALGYSVQQVDHLEILNAGTQTHAQLDAFVGSKGQPGGLASLDGAGQVSSGQLGNAYAPPIDKGVIVTGNGSASTNLPVGASNNHLLTVDASTATGIKWAQGDHTVLANIGTNTHAQLDAFVASKSQNGGLASLDGAGQVPTSQLGNIVVPIDKGDIVVGGASAPTTLGVGVNNQLLIADSAEATGIKWAQGDHTTLANVGANTHAQIDAFIDSKGDALGLATLDGTSNVPVAQLGNVADTTPVAALLNMVRPWSEAGWATDLETLRDTGVLVPVYLGTISGGSNNTYFVNLTDPMQQPFAIEITFKNTRTVSLFVDAGNGALAPLNGGYYLEPGTHTFLVPAPAFSLRSIAAGTYTDEWSDGNSITYATATTALCVYIGVGCPGGPTNYPPGSPFSIGYTLAGSPYLDGAVNVQIRGWTTP
ncbi:hypothetical protein QKT49_gp313 [Acanthamoeba castellanii medusavirus]|uniref:Uncharacterized protein n=1 Tax=Acanthamoeba castellanii medusavirus J1 TaxID=3114988 RepID=A0A3T1CX85_9VIRU|nr:hypothetical protein QKT49_gp313 [Acanthamoeba castellanii medusavirus]BBI30450.1 hypothetical protein [Acanthamoeba castellanii medusavirus J1]